METRHLLRCWALAVGSIFIASCGGGGGGGGTPQPPAPPPPVTYTIGGSTAGLVGSGLVLRNNGGDDRSLAADGAFTFATSVNSGSNYAVTVATQPSGQFCTVANGSGAASANITNVSITCVSLTIGGTVSGLAGTGLTLIDNRGSEVVVNADGAFALPTPGNSGDPYRVFIAMPPKEPVQNCTLANEFGTLASTPVSNIAVTCATHFARFAFTVNRTDGSVGTYAMDDATGQLRPRTNVKVGNDPFGLLGDRMRRSFYILNRTSATISGLDIETNTGVLTEKPSSPYVTTPSASIFTLHPTGPFYYSASNTGALYGYAMDATTGELTPVPGSPYAGYVAQSMAFSPDGRFAYLSLVSGDLVVAAVNSGTGALTEIERKPILAITSLYMARTGKFLYVIGGGVAAGYAVNQANGTLTALAGPSFALGLLTYAGAHISGKFLIFRDSGAGGLAIVAIHPTTGALTLAPQSQPITGTNFTGHPNGRFYYSAGANGIAAYAFNTDTGALTPVANSAFTLFSAFLPTVESTGKYLYVLNSQNRADVFKINPTTGGLTPAALPSINIGRQVSTLFGTGFTTPIRFRSQFAYAANQNDNTISAYTIDESTGRLSAVGAVPTGGSAPFQVVTDLRSRFAYATNVNSSSISAFQINSTSGALTAVTGSPFTAGVMSPVVMALDPLGRFLFAASPVFNEIRGYNINQTGALSPTGSVLPYTAGAFPRDLVYHPNGVYLYSVNYGHNTVTSYTVDGASLLTANGVPVPTGTGPTKMKIDPTGRFAYVVNFDSDNVSIFNIASQSGVLLGGGTVPSGDGPIALDIDPTGRFVYVANSLANTISTYAIDAFSGGLTAVGTPLATAAKPSSVQADYNGKFVHVTSQTANTVSSYSINATSGALTLISNSTVATGANPTSLVVTTGTY